MRFVVSTCGLAGVLLIAACSREAAPPQTARQQPSVDEPVYSAASIAPSGATQPAALAPGRIVSIYGQHLGPAQPCHGSPDANRRETPSPLRPNQTLIETQVFPNKLCETEVLTAGVPAGLLYVSAGQINFKVPQTAAATGETTIQVLHKGQAGPKISVSLAIEAGAHMSAETVANRMWTAFQKVNWQQPYSESKACSAVPARQGAKGGLQGHAYYCAKADDEIIAESFFHPVDHEQPKILLLRADIRAANAYPELSAEVEQFLIRRLNKTYGPGTPPGNLHEIGAWGREPGLSWSAGKLKIFLHRNRNHVEPAGVRHGVLLIAVDEQILRQRRMAQPSETYLPTATEQYPKSEEERIQAERRTRTELLQLLRKAKQSRPEAAATALLTANQKAERLGGLLVARSYRPGSGESLSLADNTKQVRLQLALHGIRYGEIGHYSGDLTYDHTLLHRAWKQYPDTHAGQQAFLKLQRLGCATKLAGCEGPNCFISVIEQGERFLATYPESQLRLQQLHHLAVANETAWSLSKAEPGDITAEGAQITKASAEQARQTSIKYHEEVLRLAPESPEANAARIALPRLKLKLGTGERTFFCFSC